jgi:arylsulfatase A-like enzyme
VISRFALARTLVAAVSAAGAVVLLAGGAPDEPASATLGENAPPNLILVSIDTTRADAISAYGGPPGLVRAREPWTPVIDGLAAEGARFDQFWAHAPTTLNSHSSMFTGLDPHGHAVPRNGFPLDPSLPTLASRLREAGWDTIGVVGAAALESGMGLSRGFRTYDDRTPDKKGSMYQDDAKGVVDRAIEAVGKRDASKPLFLFVHFYDPHAPYRPPEDWANRLDPDYTGTVEGHGKDLGDLRDQLQDGTADPRDVDHVAAMYLGEVAYVDDQLGRLLGTLREGGLLEHAVVVVTADHGETLSETPHVAYTHGGYLSEGALRIPLIVRGYGVPLAERAVVRRQAEMAGLAPTLELALGLEATLGSKRPFWDLLRPGPVADDQGWPDRPVRTALMEATRPRKKEPDSGWNNRMFWRAVRAGGFEGKALPWKGTAFALSGGERDEALRESLRGILWRWDAAAPAYRAEELSEGTEAALKSLGYLDDGE